MRPNPISSLVSSVFPRPRSPSTGPLTRLEASTARTSQFGRIGDLFSMPRERDRGGLGRVVIRYLLEKAGVEAERPFRQVLHPDRSDLPRGSTACARTKRLAADAASDTCRTIAEPRALRVSKQRHSTRLRGQRSPHAGGPHAHLARERRGLPSSSLAHSACPGFLSGVGINPS